MKYELTSQNLTGSIIVWYDDKTGHIRKVEFDCEMTNDQVLKLSKSFPTHVDYLVALKDSKAFAVRMLDEKVTFLMFWESYDKKQNKIEAMNAWEKMKAVDQQRAFSYIKRYDSILKLESYRSKMLAASYLGKRLWEDVIG